MCGVLYDCMCIKSVMGRMYEGIVVDVLSLIYVKFCVFKNRRSIRDDGGLVIGVFY